LPPVLKLSGNGTEHSIDKPTGVSATKGFCQLYSFVYDNADRGGTLEEELSHRQLERNEIGQGNLLHRKGRRATSDPPVNLGPMFQGKLHEMCRELHSPAIHWLAAFLLQVCSPLRDNVRQVLSRPCLHLKERLKSKCSRQTACRPHDAFEAT
jgi:hypothetical protein